MSNQTRLKIVIVVSLGFAVLLALAIPIRYFLAQYIPDDSELRLVAGIIVRTVILAALIYALKRLNFSEFLGLSTRFSLKQVPPIIIALVITLMAIFGDIDTYLSAGYKLLSLFLIGNILVALVEELAFRAIVLPLIIQMRSDKKRVLPVSVVFTSLIFGVLHYFNLFREPDNFSGITSQVIFASAIGIYLGGLFLRTRNIIFPIIIHFLVNVAFGKSELLPSNETVTQVVEEGTNWTSLLLTLGLFGCIAMGGVYMVSLVNKQEILNSLNLKVSNHEME